MTDKQARDAGHLIRFFLDGGNDCEIVGGEERGAMIVLARLRELLDEDTYSALVDEAGFEWYYGSMGTPLLRRKEVA